MSFGERVIGFFCTCPWLHCIGEGVGVVVVLLEVGVIDLLVVASTGWVFVTHFIRCIGGNIIVVAVGYASCGQVATRAECVEVFFINEVGVRMVA